MTYVAPVRPAETSILAAATRTPIPEDTLTEIFACVLAANPVFTRRIVELGRGVSAEHFEIGTQRTTASGRRVDMQITSYRGRRSVGVLYIENKEWAGFLPNQLVDYSRDVLSDAGAGGHGSVLAIVGSPRQAQGQAAEDGRVVTWQVVASEADEAGRSWEEGPGDWRWREEAFQHDAPVRWRYLAELIAYLESRGLAHMDALTAEDVIVARYADATEALIKRLHEQAIENAPSIDLVASGRDKRKAGKTRTRYLEPLVPSDHWAVADARFGLPTSVLMYVDADDRFDAPAYWLGFFWEEEVSDEGSEALASDDWQQLLADVDLYCNPPDDVSVGSWKYLSELVVQGRTFEDQTIALVRWAEATVRALAELKPPPLVKLPETHASDVT